MRWGGIIIKFLFGGNHYNVYLKYRLTFEGVVLIYICTLYPPMLTELLYPLQYGGDAPLHFAAKEGHTTCVERLLSTPGIDVNIKNKVSWSI